MNNDRHHQADQAGCCVYSSGLYVPRSGTLDLISTIFRSSFCRVCPFDQNSSGLPAVSRGCRGRTADDLVSETGDQRDVLVLVDLDAPHSERSRKGVKKEWKAVERHRQIKSGHRWQEKSRWAVLVGGVESDQHCHH